MSVTILPDDCARAIRYDRSTNDYTLYLDGCYVGSAATYSDGERRLDELVYERTRRDAAADAAELEPTVTAQADAGELEHEACVGADFVTRYVADQARMGHNTSAHDVQVLTRLLATPPRTVAIDLDCLIAAVEHARLTRPSRRVESAYEYLAERDYVEFDADGCLLVDSATWSNTQYRVTIHGCTCPARKPCWHDETYRLVRDAQRRAQRAQHAHTMASGDVQVLYA